MVRSIGALLLVMLCACSDSGGMPLEDAGGDAVVMDASDGAVVDGSMDAAPDAPACACSGVSTCCDGCMPRNLNVDCEDALICTRSRCSAAGACVSTGVPITCASPAEPECQAAMCSAPGGCATTHIREGMSCSDDNAGTGNDHCVSGACVGTVCQCSSGPCCDGCFFRPASFACIDDGPITATCTGPDFYGGLCPGVSRIHLQYGDRFCTGASSACTGTKVPSAVTTDGPCEPGGSNPEMPNVCRVDAGDPLGARCAFWCE
jgi:hypothetical protein